MKNTQRCPKCESSDIMRIPHCSGNYGAGPCVQLGLFSFVEVTRYLCGNCGFIESWVDDPDGIAKLRKKYG